MPPVSPDRRPSAGPRSVGRVSARPCFGRVVALVAWDACPRQRAGILADVPAPQRVDEAELAEIDAGLGRMNRRPDELLSGKVKPVSGR